MAGVPAVNLGIRKGLDRFGIDARPASLALIVLLSSAAVWLAVEAISGRDAMRAVVTLLAELVALIAVPLAIDYARRLAPTGYKPLIAVVVGILLAVLGLLRVYETWVPTAATAAMVVTATTLVGIVVAHLSFLGAFSLLWHGGEGTLTTEEAEQGLAWRDYGHPKPAAARVRRIVNLVHPGAKNPHGPLQRKVSEIFDTDEPPFFKSFLRLEVNAETLVVRCYGVRGNEASAGDVQVVDEVEIPLPRGDP